MMKLTKAFPMQPKRVLFIATRQIGDVLVTTPLIQQARKIWPHAQFHFLGYRGKLDMLKGNPDIQEFIETSDRPSLGEYLSLFNHLFQRYDLAFITQPSDRSYIYGLLAAFRKVGVIGGPPQGGLDRSKSDRQNAWKKWINFHTVEIDYFHQHVAIEKLRLLEPFVQDPASLFINPINVTPPAAEKLTPTFSGQLRTDYVVIHPCPLTAYKRWPLAYWQMLIAWIAKQGYQVVLSGSPAKQDLELNLDILSLLDEETRNNVINTEGKLNLPQIGTLLRNAAFYVGVDTSTTHLAAACDTKTIALFGPTPPTNFGPWPNGFVGKTPYLLRAREQTVGNVTVLQGPGDCVPCRKAGCEDRIDSRSECLDLLDAQQVISAIKNLLNP